MKRSERNALVAMPVIVAVGGAIAWAGSHGSVPLGPLPLFAWCAALAFAINWLVFVPSYLAQTEKYFDLTGSLSYVSVVALALAFGGGGGARAGLIAGLVIAWAVRLGTFLFGRIRRDGGDGRFDALKSSLPRFAMTWTLQGLWVLLTLSCGLAAITSARPVPLDGFAAAGALLWAVGFGIEVAADRQKSRFRADPSNRDRFIDTGLWAWSRHPNYFGEITLWVGIALIAVPALSGWQYLTLVSPVFVYLLLTRISGIPLLESRGRKKWGELPPYQAYVERTPALFPRPPRSA